MSLTKDMILFLLSSVLVSSEQSHSMSNKDDEEVSEHNVIESTIAVDGQSGVVSSGTQLLHRWTLWYEQKTQMKKNHVLRKEDYLKELKQAGSFNSIPAFWKCWNEVREILTLQTSSQGINFHLFRDNIKPVWEDQKNIKGGKWVVILPTTTSQEDILKSWSSLMLNLILGELGFQSEINGAVLAVRSWGSTVSIWNRNANDRELIEVMSSRLKEFFGVSFVKYQRHQVSMRRNTDKVKHSRPKRLSYSSDDKSSSSNEASSSSEGEQENFTPRRGSVVNVDTKDIPIESLPIITTPTNIVSEQQTQPQDDKIITQLEQKPQLLENIPQLEVNEKAEEFSSIQQESSSVPSSPDSSESSKNKRRRRKANTIKKAIVQPRETTTTNILKPKIPAQVIKQEACKEEKIPIVTLGLGLVLVAASSAISWALYL